MINSQSESEINPYGDSVEESKLKFQRKMSEKKQRRIQSIDKGKLQRLLSNKSSSINHRDSTAFQ